MTHKLGNNNFIGVEVPEDAKNIKITNRGECLRYNSESENYGFPYDLYLPQSGFYTFCFLYPDGVTEDWAEKIVDWYEDSDDSSYDPMYSVTTYFNVFYDYVGQGYDLSTALESLRTLFQSLNIHDKTIAVCKRK